MNVVYTKHFENGKKYVGITNNFKRRMAQHRNPELRLQHLPIYKAMKKYSHYTEIVFESELYEDVLRMEIIVISNFRDLGINLYNLTSGGCGMLGHKHTEETKKKLREANLGENNPMYGKPVSEETRIKLSIKLSGEAHPNYGKSMSEAMRKKISEANSGENHYMYGKKHKEETILKMKENHADNKGEKSPRANAKEHYETNPTRRDKFKRTCERMGWEYLSFKETFSGEYYIDTKGRKERKYFYLFLGDNNLVDFDWSTSKNRPKEYYVSNPVLKSSFKTSCEIQGWNVGDFEEVFSGEYYHFKDINRKIKKYFYIYKGGRDDK